MQPVSPDAERYDGTTILLHWATAILVLAQWIGAQLIDWVPRGALRVDARSLHIVGGLVLAVLLATRLAWRLTRGRRLPPQQPAAFAWIARATHGGLYALLAVMLAVGIGLTWVRGDSLFNLFRIPSLAPGDHALADQIQDIHGTIGWVILAVAGAHAAAALVHRHVWRDRVMERMLPGSRT